MADSAALNTGAEAVETALKLARKWAYKAKGVPKDEALVFSVADHFHGRTRKFLRLVERRQPPSSARLSRARRGQALCKKHNVLFICDEIQTGIGRTGRKLCSQWANIKPDIVTLGKAISGGLYPVNCVMSSKEILLVDEPGTHGSTYGRNPLSCAASIRALEIIEEEDLTAKAERLGHVFR
ncbi:ornithine aminotransferase [Neonectria magnoliae]|uniref:Ornithine aminotransferase n=1 Tax=Neonectria magnoliae TaxID=2732573 RepID=A0ABR1IKG7_9HYPO